MFERIAEMRRSLEVLLDGLDPSACDPADAARVWEELDRIGRLAAAGKTLLAARVKESRVWVQAGYRTPAQWMAATSGDTVGAAESTLEASAQLESLPATAAALRSGALSAAQARVVVDAAAVAPEREGELLVSARKDSLCGLKRTAQKVKASAAGDEQARYARIHAGRYLKSWTDDDGAVRVDLRMTPDAGARFLAGVAHYRKQIFDQARLDGRRDPYPAYSADAAELMAVNALNGTRSAKSKAKPTMHVRVDLDALRRGHTEPGEVCEVGGIPFPVARARELLDDAIVWLLLVEGIDVRKIIRLDRHIPPALRQALIERDRVCDVMGCDRTDGLEFDHVIDFAAGGPTSYDQLRRPCHWHHHLKSCKGYRYEGPPGQAVLIPPDDS